MPLRLIALLLLVACGSSSEHTPDAGPSPDAWSEACLSRNGGCNPVSQTGCGVGEKCTWIRWDASHGSIGCAPDQPPTTACEFGPDGEITGFDNCPAGDVCIEHICIASPNTCNHATCVQHAGLFCAIDNYGACELP